MMQTQSLKTLLITSFMSSGFLAMPQTAFAKDDCTDAKQLVKAMTAFFGADAALKDVINPTFKLSMQALEGHPELSGLLYRYEGDEHRFDLAEDGEVLNLEVAVDKLSPKGELCLLVDGKTVEDKEESVAEATASFTFPYQNQTGKISLAELREGVKDGSKVMKSLAPGGLGFVVPKLKSIVLSPADSDGALPKMTFIKNGEVIEGLEAIKLGRGQYYHISDFKKLKVDQMQIEGDYRLEANFDFKDEELQDAETQRLARLEKDNAQGNITDTVAPE